jgi:hypothetical protein
MDTKGTSMFVRQCRAPSPRKLDGIFKKCHGTNKTTKTDHTWLIHPSPVSEAALDLAFQTRPTFFSPYSMDFFAHVTHLKKALVLFCLADFICYAKPWSPIATVLRVLSETSFCARIETEFAAEFERALLVYLTLGVVPVSLRERKGGGGGGKKTRTSPSAAAAGSLPEATERYLQLLNSGSRVVVVDVGNLRQNTLITFRDGTYGCSDYEGHAAFDLQTFGRQSPSVRAPFLDMMQYEYQYVFANDRHRHQTIEKMIQTRVIVSSTLTKDASAALDHIRGNLRAADRRPPPSEPSGKVDLLEAKAEVIKAAAVDPTEDDDDDFTQLTRQKLQALQSALNTNATLERKLRKHNMDAAADDDDDDAVPETAYHSHGIRHSTNTLHGDPQKNVSKIAQERVLVERVRELSRQNGVYKRKMDVLRDELLAMLEYNAKLNYEGKIRQAKLEVNEKKLLAVTKHRDRAETALTDYEEVLLEMKNILRNTLDNMNAGARERARLLNLFADQKSAVPSSLDGSRIDRRVVSDFLTLVLGSNRAEKVAIAAADTGERQRTFDVVLDDNRVFVVPFFTSVQNRSVLNARNYWLPHEWMHDWPTVLMNDAADRNRAVTDTPELFMLDVNPKSERESRKLKQIIEETDGTLLTSSSSVYERTFLNVQFPTQGGVKTSINDSLKEKWHFLTRRLLRLTEETYTKTGQRINYRVGEDSIRHFVLPFVRDRFGRRGHEDWITSAIVSVLYPAADDDDDDDDDTADDEGRKEEKKSPFEKFVYFCMKKIKTMY